MGILLVGLIAFGAWALAQQDAKPAQRAPRRALPADVHSAIEREEARRTAAATPIAPDPHAPDPAAPIVSKPPFDGPTHEQWARYAALSQLATLGHVEPDGRLGVWLAGPNQLAEDGIMVNVRRRADGSGWDGDWVPPHSRARFLGSQREQWEAFQRQGQRHAASIRQRLGARLGKPIPGAPSLPAATLSGLMAVARHAGLGGLDKWIANQSRKATTTAVYSRFNGIF